MGKPKTKVRYTNPDTKMDVGVQLLTIKTIRWARNSVGEIIGNDDNEKAFDITFINPLDQTITHRFWTNDKSIWVLDKLRRAIGVYKENMQTPASEMIGRKCYGIVGAEFYFDENGLVREGGVLRYKKHLLPMFFPPLGDGPHRMGDPSRSKGVPSEDFLINPGVVLDDYLTEEDRSFLLEEMGTRPPNVPLDQIKQQNEVKYKVVSSKTIEQDKNLSLKAGDYFDINTDF
jgi:hypothetical protein